MSKIKPIYGIFSDGIPHIRFGSGEKTIIVFLGGPGNELPKGIEFKMYSKSFIPFMKDYTIYLVTRKSGLHQNYTTLDMSNDYAEMIDHEFKGRVDVLVGISYGGLILQHFAVDHPDKSEYKIIAMATHIISKKGIELDLKFATYLSEGKKAKAYASISDVFASKGLKKYFYKIMLFTSGLFMKNPKSKTFSDDVIIEAKAEESHNTKDRLSNITVPILILCGDKDFFNTKEDFEEMAQLIPKTILKVYPNKGHDIFSSKRFSNDILEFISNKQINS